MEGFTLTARTQQLLATALFGAAVVTGSALVVPQLLAGQPAPVVAELPAELTANSIPIDGIAADASVDMSHWQETAHPKSPFKPGKIKKGK